MTLKQTDYQICNRCIMDTSDPLITFDDRGYCNHCCSVEKEILPHWFPNDQGRKKINSIVQKIKQSTKNKQYDCIIGLSGGIDSSFLAYWAKNIAGLKPLAVHVDAGWNSNEAVSNIKNLTNILGIDLHTIVINWEEMKDLQLAFLKSQVANQDTPQDHAFFAGLYTCAVENNIKYVLNGSNFATESILPTAWGYNAMDSRQLCDIYKKNSSGTLKDFPSISLFKRYIYYPYIKGMKVVTPLNYMYYNKNNAIAVLKDQCGWKSYGDKHHESRFTKFFQSYYLPTKFGYDKRRAHLSSEIMSSLINRSDALKIIQKSPYNEITIDRDIMFVAKKLGVSKENFLQIMSMPNKTFRDYKSLSEFIKVYKKLKKYYRLITK